MNQRIAYVCVDPGVPVFGTKGASVHVQEIIRAWRARGAEVHLYCVRTGDHLPADLADLPVTCIKVKGSGGEAAAREAAQQEVSTRLADRIILDGADLVYERYSLFSTTLAQVHAATGAPGVLEVNAPLIEEQAEHRVLVDAAGAEQALRRQVHAAAGVACVAEPVADWVRTRVPDLAAPVKVSVVPNGVNTDRIQVAREELGSGREATVVFVGTLKPWHGTDVLIDALSRRDERWRLRIVGDGPQRAELEEQARRLQVPVEFVGAVAPEQIPDALTGAAVAVAPYPVLGEGGADDQAHYFSPLKVFEYAAAGLPVVASAVGQLPRIVQHGRTGLLVPPSNPTALAQAIDSLVADPLWAAEIGDAARAEVVATRSWPVVLDATLRTVPGDWDADSAARGAA